MSGPSPAGARPRSITLFTTTQSPLPVRYARPARPTLVLPPLIHRSLHTALDASPLSVHIDESSGSITIPHPEKIAKHDVPAASQQKDHELTVKVHLVGDAASTSDRAAWVEESLGLLQSVKGLGGVDTLLVGFRGIDYKGKKSAASGWGDWGCGTDNPEDEGPEGSASSSEIVQEELASEVEATWAALEHLQASASSSSTSSGQEDRRKVDKLGTLYLPLEMLRRLADRPVPPKINAMDTPDCHHLPKEYSDFAKGKGIELWAGGGGEGADPLPAADLHNLLQEFYAHLEPELPQEQKQAFHGLSAQLPVEEGKWSKGVKPAVQIRWVLGYTLLSTTRNLVSDKGYIIAAELTGA